MYKISLIAKTRHLFDVSMARLCMSTVLPVFSYCSVCMVGNRSDLEKLQKLQNMALRIILQCYFSRPIYSMHQEVRIDTLSTICEKCLVKQCFNWIHGNGPKFLDDLMKPNILGPVHWLSVIPQLIQTLLKYK